MSQAYCRSMSGLCQALSWCMTRTKQAMCWLLWQEKVVPFCWFFLLSSWPGWVQVDVVCKLLFAHVWWTQKVDCCCSFGNDIVPWLFLLLQFRSDLERKALESWWFACEAANFGSRWTIISITALHLWRGNAHKLVVHVPVFSPLNWQFSTLHYWNYSDLVMYFPWFYFDLQG